MLELLAVAAIAAAGALIAIGLIVRSARARARARAERVLDDLAAAVASALADPGTRPRTADRLVARYERARAGVAGGRTYRDFEAIVLRHRVGHVWPRRATARAGRLLDELAGAARARARGAG
ncbi:MAG: hypothetical protein AB7V42_07530 [Thermoleophilia bacterium]